MTRQLIPMAAPAYMLELDDRDITNNIAPRLISLTVTDNRGLSADDLTLVLDDADGQIQMPWRGATLRVSLGYKGESLLGVGKFIIDQVKHEGAPDKVTVIGRSADFSKDLNKERETSWHDTTLGAIVSAIAARYQLKTSMPDSLTQMKVAHIDQTMESDASFLHRLAVRYGAALAIKWDKVMFVKPGRGKGPDGKPFSQVNIARRDGDSHVYEVAERLNYNGVVARWLDTKDAKKQLQQVQLQRKTTPQAASGATHPQSQATAGTQTFPADQKENLYIISTIFPGKEEAEKAAESLWNQIQSNSAKFTLTLALGRADITPETPVRVSGFKEEINNTPWVIAKVTHVMNNSGFISKLELEVKIEEGQYDAA